jgi:uncharacterized protein (TIGR03435 family)
MTEFTVGNIAFRTRLLFVSGCFAAFTMLALGQTSDQSPQDTPAKSPAYAVVSVRPSKPCTGMQTNSPPGRLSYECVTLWELMFNAYGLTPNDSHTAGLPGWANAAQFDIEAKMDDDTAAALQKLPREEQQKQRERMLQSILVDRFKLKIHHEIKEGPIYALVIAKGGPKLKEWPAGQRPMGVSWSDKRIDIRGGPIERLVFCLSDGVDRTVVDKTGLTGIYDISLKWTPDSPQAAPDAGPSLFTAIEEQIGLELVSTKGPVDTIIVDHAEKPSED